MKKLGKKLNNFMKLFLVFGMLFNNLSSLSIVFADEITDQDIVGRDEIVAPIDDEVLDTLEYTVSVEDTQVIIKYAKANELEGNLVINELLTYLDMNTSEVDNEIELTDEVKEALASDSGYVFNSSLLEDNILDGEYVVTVTLGEEEKVANLLIENEEGLVFNVYAGDELVAILEDGTYSVPSDTNSLSVVATLLTGGIVPGTTYMIGEEEYLAEDLFQGIYVKDIMLEGYLYGEFTEDVSLTLTNLEVEELYEAELTIKYGTYQENTDKLNESAKNTELSNKYIFAGDTANGYLYAFDEVNSDEVESIVKDMVNENVTYTLEDGIELTDGRVTITYTNALLDENVEVNGRLDAPISEINTGDTFTVNYVVSLKDYMINGISGTIKYDEEALELLNVGSSIFAGNVNEEQFMYVGEGITGSLSEDETGTQVVNEEEYIVLSATFKALKAGDTTVAINNGKFFDNEKYYVANEDIETNIVVNASTDNTLASLVVGEENVELQEGQLEYEITVENDVTKVSVEALTANIGAEAKVNMPEELVEGENTITIQVIAENGDIKVYTVKVTRKAKEETKNEVVSPIVYQENNTDDNVPEITLEPTITDLDDDDDETDDEITVENNKNVTKIIIIILILLTVAGLIYLIFKSDDDEETKKVNKDINKLKKEDNVKVENKNNNVKKKVNKKER